jgi:NAD(P)-dependent dehydrogenase (short-subunit alcohol dehydrogenase family)
LHQNIDQDGRAGERAGNAEEGHHAHARDFSADLCDLGRIGEPDDIGNAIAFLAAPESGWITAQMLTVDGGRMDYIAHG